MSHSRISIQLNQDKKPSNKNKNPYDNKQKKSSVEEIYVSDSKKKPIYLSSRRDSSQKLNRKKWFSGKWRKSIWYRIGAPVTTAIVIGLVFGFVVLSIFVNNEWDSKAVLKNVNHHIDNNRETGSQSSKDSANASAMDEKEISENDTTAQKSGGLSSATIEVPSQQFYMVQAGVFEDKTGAETSVEAFRKKGWPSIYSQRDSFHLFLGTAKKRENALAIATFYQENNVEIYIKEWSIPGFSGTIKMEGDVETFQGFVADGNRLFVDLASVSSQGMSSTIQVDENHWNQIVDTHRRYLETAKNLALPSATLEWTDQMKNDLTNAVSALEHYRKQQSSSFLWQVQQGLLQYINTYQKFVSSLNTEA